MAELTDVEKTWYAPLPQQPECRTLSARSIYGHDVDRYPLLTEEEERELGRRKDKGDRTAYELLVNSNLRLVLSYALKYTRNEMDTLDLIQECNTGLMRAAEKYDYRLEARFSTYAMRWIRERGRRWLDQRFFTMHVPHDAVCSLYQLQKMQQRLISRLGRIPTVDELAQSLGWDEGKVTLYQELGDRRNLSLDSPQRNGHDTFKDFLPDGRQTPPDTLLEDKEELDLVVRELRTILGQFSRRDASIIAKRFGLFDGHAPMEFPNIARDHGLTKQRIQQIVKRGLKSASIDGVEPERRVGWMAQMSLRLIELQDACGIKVEVIG